MPGGQPFARPQALSQKCNSASQIIYPTYPQIPTQIALGESTEQTGEASMRVETAEDRSSQSEERRSYGHDEGQNAMSPVRRAALEALEREFRDLLNASPR